MSQASKLLGKNGARNQWWFGGIQNSLSLQLTLFETKYTSDVHIVVTDKEVEWMRRRQRSKQIISLSCVLKSVTKYFFRVNVERMKPTESGVL